MSHTAGMTFRFCDAVAIVGESVIASNGSTRSANTGEIARARASASSADVGASPVTICNIACTSGIRRRSARYAPSFSISGAAFTSALSAMFGIDA